MDHDEMAEQLREMWEQVTPEGPFVGSAPGVEVEVSFEGELVDLVLDEPVYRVAGSTELGRAVVAAHRAARESAVAAQQESMRALLEELGLDDPAGRPA